MQWSQPCMWKSIAAEACFGVGDSLSIGARLKFQVSGATAGERIVRVRNLKIRVHTRCRRWGAASSSTDAPYRDTDGKSVLMK